MLGLFRLRSSTSSPMVTFVVVLVVGYLPIMFRSKYNNRTLKNCCMYLSVVSSCQTVIRQLSGSCQAVVRPSSGHRWAVVRSSLGSRKTVLGQS